MRKGKTLKVLHKWEIIEEFILEINRNDMLDQIANDIGEVCYAPLLGYRSWIFEYKGVLMLLFDAGNGHYQFMQGGVSYFQVFMNNMYVFLHDLVYNHIKFIDSRR